ncbi:MAG: hypothetical protein ACXADO_03315 [Candidatus Thorarchaeota archaeon]
MRTKPPIDYYSESQVHVFWGEVMESVSQSDDLYGVSPVLIAEIMAIVIVLVPYGAIPREVSWMFLQGFFYPETVFYSVLWVFTPRTYDPFLIVVLRPDILWFTLPYSLFNIVFALKVVRYFQGRVRKLTVIIFGFISLIVPSVLLTVWLSIGSLEFVVPGVIWPIPVQFLVGIILVHFIRGPEPIPKDEHGIRELSLTAEELDEIYDE